MSVTREIAVAGLIDDHFVKLAYEFGHNIWNENIKGFSFEYVGIPIYDKMSVDVKVHHVDKCVSNTLLTLNFEHLYLRWKHHLKQYNDLESTDRLSVGFKF